MNTKLASTTETPKLKINTTVQVYDTIELDIDLPYFCKTPDNVFYKIANKDQALRVTPSGVLIITPSYDHNAKEIASAVAVSEKDFNQALETTRSNIKTLAA